MASSPSTQAPACQARRRARARASRSPASPRSPVWARRSMTRQAVGVEATSPTSPGWSRSVARSLRQSPPSASMTARSVTTLPARCRARPGCPRPAQRSSSPGNPSRSANSTSSAAPACPTTPSPSAVTSTRARGLVACTRKVPSLTGIATFRQPHSPSSARAPSHTTQAARRTHEKPRLGGWCFSRVCKVAGCSGIGVNHMDVILQREWPMTAGTTPKQADLWRGTAAVCEGRVGEQSIWAVLYREGDRLFADELFADLFAEVGRRSVPPRIVATVMVLQRLQGLSDREAVEAFSFDARWKYACGGLAFDYPGFSHTVLVDMRARLAASTRPERIFEATVAAARQAGLVGVRRVLDSTPLYDAVATMDTVTLLGAAIRGLLKVAEEALAAELRGVLAGGDDYADLAKPQIDWDDQAARAALVDARARDAHAVLGVLQGRPLPA